MRFNDMLLKILEFIRDNYDNLFKTNDDKAIISSSIEFLEKDKEFLSLIKSNNIEDVKRLGILSKELKKINDDFELYKKINHVNSTNGVGLISNIIVRNFDAIFKDKENKIAINKKLNDIFFVPEYDYVGLFNLLFQNKNLSDSSKLKIFFNISSLLKELYTQSNDIDVLNKINNINKSLEKVQENSLFKRKRKNDLYELVFGKEQINKNVNIFDLLYDFGDFKNNNIISNDKEDVNLLKELVSESGPFNGLSFDYIAKVLYSFIVLNNRAFDIMSDKDGYAFKDLSPISDIIKRRTYDGENADNVILNLASGKTLITFNEQTSNDKERKGM